jgi:signal transduction histidine kinase/CheY-like chemotaxis protein
MKSHRVLLALGCGIAMVLLLCMVIATREINVNQPETRIALSPPGGFARSFADWNTAFERLRGELSAINAGKAMYVEDVRFQSTVLQARSKELFEQKGSDKFFGQLTRGSSFSLRVKNLVERMNAEFKKTNLSRRDVQGLLFEFDALQSTIEEVATEIDKRETLEHQESLRLTNRRENLTIFTITCAAVLAFLSIAWSVFYTKTLSASERLKASTALALKEATEAKAEFLSLVSHEIRSQLQRISGAVEILLLKVYPPEVAQLLGRIQGSTTSLNRYLRDLLTISADEAGTLEIKPESFDARRLVGQIVDEFSEEANRKNLAIHVSIAGSVGTLIADPIRISQILRNLLSNAVKYTDDGSVFITAAHEMSHERGGLRIVIQDTGPGIDPALRDAMFLKHRRLGAIDRTGASSGIGLAVVKAVARQMGATIKVTSRPQKGTKFELRIPVEVPVQEVANPDFEQGSLLVIDDQIDILELLAELAKANGIDVDLARSASEAANKLGSRPYLAVLFDINMPIKRGDQIAQEARRGNGPNCNSFFVAMTAAENASIGSAWPFNLFIAKPIDGGDLLTMMKKASKRNNVQIRESACVHATADLT